MSAHLVIGVDCSTTGCKVIAWDRHGRPTAEGRASFEMLHPRPSWYEQDADAWWQGAARALADLASRIDVRAVEALSVTHQRESFVPVDRAGRPLRNAILWLDERARLQVEALERRLGAELIHRTTGRPPSMIPALPKILWLSENEPEVLNKAARVLDCHALLVHRLCGVWRTSLASADPLGLIDMERGCWWDAILPEIGLTSAQLPEIVAAGAPIGSLNAEAARATGLPEGLPVFAGGGDGQCAGLGAGATAPRRPYLNMGTAVVAGAWSPRYLTDRAFRTLCAPVAGAFFLETCLKGGVYTVGWFVERWGRDLGASPEQALEREAAAVPLGADGLLLVPYWHNVLNPYWDPAASGITVGWTGAHGRGHFYRALLEGIAYEQRLAGDGVMDSLGLRFDEYVILGGGSRSDLWCRIMADVTGVPAVRAAESEATCLGAGILAAAGAGWYPDALAAASAMTRTGERFEPEPGRAAAHDRIYREVYRPLFPKVQPLVDRLTEITDELRESGPPGR